MAERYELGELLGSGGMGAVWKAHDRETGQTVALKLLHQFIADQPEYLHRFEREAELAARVESPHVVRVLDHGLRQGVPYLAMEYIDGESLRQVLARRSRLPWPEARVIAAGVASALAAAHGAGVVHGDVKPSNILVGGDGTVRLADFGVARPLATSRPGVYTAVFGTPAYAAPDARHDERSDLYSLGVVLYEMLSGRPPFAGDAEALARLHRTAAPDLALLPDEARELAGWLLAKHPGERPAGAAEVAALLETGGPLLLRAGRRRRARTHAIAVAVLLLLAGATGAVGARAGRGVSLPEPPQAPGPIADADILVRNDGFNEGLAGWSVRTGDGCGDPAAAVAGAAVIRLARSGARGCSGWVELRQEVGVTLPTPERQFLLDLDLALDEHSSCGGGGSARDFPLFVSVLYRDARDVRHEFAHAFYTGEPCGEGPATRVPAGSWYRYRADLHSLEASPVFVESITVGAGGRSFDTRIALARLHLGFSTPD